MIVNRPPRLFSVMTINSVLTNQQIYANVTTSERVAVKLSENDINLNKKTGLFARFFVYCITLNRWR